ncbi:unnamed protein product [Didymodactylos carnosus]|uniref:Uncharacterized protein n=1 Tax=Didymodactylos carnosus TaxID=1234261 RepID=A0A8S2XXG3_9BILA|nr:unnamed protein product [Didymodactylos carnosus]
MHIVFSGKLYSTPWNYSNNETMKNKKQIKTAPFRNFTNIWLNRTFTLDSSTKDKYRHYYLYLSYYFSYVNITIDNRYKIDLEDPSIEYVFIPLNYTIQNMFKSNINRTYTIDVHASYYWKDKDSTNLTSITDKYIYMNMTYVDVGLAFMS